MIWFSINTALVVNRFEIKVAVVKISDSSHLVANRCVVRLIWFKIQTSWLSMDLIQVIWMSNDLDSSDLVPNWYVIQMIFKNRALKLKNGAFVQDVLQK